MPYYQTGVASTLGLLLLGILLTFIMRMVLKYRNRQWDKQAQAGGMVDPDIDYVNMTSSEIAAAKREATFRYIY